MQVFHGVGIEPGADLAYVNQAAVLVSAERERGEGPAPLFAFLPAQDDKFVSPFAFDLAPVAGPGAAVGLVGPLGNNALAARLADRGKGIVRRAVDDRGQLCQPEWRCVVKDLFQPLAPVGELSDSRRLQCWITERAQSPGT